MPDPGAFARPWPRAAALDASLGAKSRARVAAKRGAVHPTTLLAAEYRSRLTRLIEEMARSVRWWVSAEWRKNPPAMTRLVKAEDGDYRELAGALMALDAQSSPAQLQATINVLRRRWGQRFEQMAAELAEHFAADAAARTDARLMGILRRGGMTVKFKLTPAVRQVLQGIVHENVSLIKSIPAQYLTQVEGSVMQSVTAGRDLHSLVEELQHHHGVTRRRADTIARDQNNKATGAIATARMLDVGIAEAIWCHSRGGMEPRPTHLRNDQQKYDVAKGWFDPDPKVRRFIRPGELVNCRCFSKPVL